MLTAQMPDDDVTGEAWFENAVEGELDHMMSDQNTVADEIRKLEDELQADSAGALAFLVINRNIPRAAQLQATFLEDRAETLRDRMRAKAERRVLRRIEKARYE